MADSPAPRCGIGLTVAIRHTVYEMRCDKPAGHEGNEHETPQGSTWTFRPPKRVKTDG